MNNHANVENNQRAIPHYAVYKDGLISGFFGDFSFLSNFYPCPEGVGMGELVFPSVEHAYQAAKWPSHLRYQFVNISAGQAKKLGKIAPRFDTKKWNKQKYDIMQQLNWSKYNTDSKLKAKLLATDGFILEERNSWGDMDWGVNENGVGENNLGKILMRIRERIILEQKGESW